MPDTGYGPRNDLFQAMAEPAPCDGCSRAPRCGAEQLACTAFERFEKGLRWEISPRNDATRERYLRLGLADH